VRVSGTGVACGVCVCLRVHAAREGPSSARVGERRLACVRRDAFFVWKRVFLIAVFRGVWIWRIARSSEKSDRSNVSLDGRVEQGGGEGA